MNLPKHECGLSLEHQPHKAFCDSVEEYFDLTCEPDWPSEEARQRAISEGQLWTLKWYPSSTICFNHAAAPTLPELLDFVNSKTWEV